MERRAPTTAEALAVLAGTVLVVGGVVFLAGAPIPVALGLACALPAALGLRLGLSWREIEAGMIEGVGVSLQATLILLVVGATIAAWAAGGVIATMVHAGLGVLGPRSFLPAACAICSLVSLAIGSSWTTAATVGVALMGIGDALGVPAPMSAGAVISGAYFGDKMSPLSDTTNLAPAVAGSELFEHVGAMVATTLPAWLLTMAGFAALGLHVGADPDAWDPARVDALRAALAVEQHVSALELLPVALVVALALVRAPALPALVVAAAAGSALAVAVQGVGAADLLALLYSGYRAGAADPAVDALLSRGGVASMFDTVAIILAATAFGGAMERVGASRALLAALLRRVRTPAGLVAATVGSCIATNALLAEQYLSIVLPGRMVRTAYARFGLAPRMLSRVLEDGGTVTSCLFPWNSGGAFMSTTLGVATTAYAPFALLNLLVPVISVLTARLGLFVLRTEPAGNEAASAV